MDSDNGSRSRRSRVGLIGLVAALVALAAVAGGLASGLASGEPARPTLAVFELRSSDVVAVQGTGFTPNRRVRVTLLAVHRRVHRPLADRHGVFTTTFSTAVDRCSGWSISASQRGRATVVVRGPKPECAPASTP
jgi:hypothetical protein